MRKWQSRLVTQGLNESLAELQQAEAAKNPQLADFWIEQALLSTRAGLNEAHRQQIDQVLRVRRQQRGY